MFAFKDKFIAAFISPMSFIWHVTSPKVKFLLFSTYNRKFSPAFFLKITVHSLPEVMFVQDGCDSFTKWF